MISDKFRANLGFAFWGNLGWDMPEVERGPEDVPMLELKFYERINIYNYICGKPLPAWWIGAIGYRYEILH